jgi:hypothetical protein
VEYDGRRCIKLLRTLLAAAQALRRGHWPVAVIYVGESKVICTRLDEVLRGLKHVLGVPGGSKYISLLMSVMRKLNPRADVRQFVRLFWSSAGSVLSDPEQDAMRMTQEAVMSATMLSQVARGEIHGDNTSRGATGDGGVLIIPTNVVSGGDSACNPYVKLMSMGAGASGNTTLRDLLEIPRFRDVTEYLLVTLEEVSCDELCRSEVLGLTAKRGVSLLSHYHGERSPAQYYAHT